MQRDDERKLQAPRGSVRVPGIAGHAVHVHEIGPEGNELLVNRALGAHVLERVRDQRARRSLREAERMTPDRNPVDGLGGRKVIRPTSRDDEGRSSGRALLASELADDLLHASDVWMKGARKECYRPHRFSRADAAAR